MIILTGIVKRSSSMTTIVVDVLGIHFTNVPVEGISYNVRVIELDRQVMGRIYANMISMTRRVI